VELTKAQLQVQYDVQTTRYSGPIDCARQIYANNGVAGLYRGLQANLIYRGGFCILWSSFEFYRRLYTQWSQKEGTFLHPSMIPFLAGGSAANTFWLIAFPADVVKNRIMSQADVRPLKYTSVGQCIQYIYRSEGWRGFYRGFLPAMMRSFPTNGAAIFMFDTSFRYLSKLLK
jgi:solute carrier family 25 carnitine/acylcarnitine transporter 20/29